MRSFFDDDFVPWLGVHFDGDLIAHHPRGNEECCFASEELSSVFLELIDRRIFTEDVVADFSLGHGATHRRCRLGDRIAAEVYNLLHNIKALTPAGTPLLSPLDGRGGGGEGLLSLRLHDDLPRHPHGLIGQAEVFVLSRNGERILK